MNDHPVHIGKGFAPVFIVHRSKMDVFQHIGLMIFAKADKYDLILKIGIQIVLALAAMQR